VTEKMTAPATGTTPVVSRDEATAPPAATLPRTPARSGRTGVQDQVTVRMPAEGAYLSVLRTATAGLAARLDFTLDEIEDLRIAVDEACAILLPLASPDADVTCRFSVTPLALHIDVSVPATGTNVLPGNHSFSWQVLTALAGEVSADHIDNVATIHLIKRRF
jgi:serine/threonine-protein kinase RsbW